MLESIYQPMMLRKLFFKDISVCYLKPDIMYCGKYFVLNTSTSSSLTFALIMELGISTFVELTPDPLTGKTISAYQRLQNLMEEVELADQLGLDVFAIGEHHRPEYLISSPATVLAAAAVKTKQIKL